MRRLRAFALFAVVLSACTPLPRSLPADWDVLFFEPEGESISEPILLVSDNQVHNLYADPIPLRRTGLGNRLVQVAIRPVQLDLYGLSFLDYVIAHDGRNLPILHLGDACNLSCTGEFARFVSSFRRAPRGWAMAPGNHDGFFFGNEQADPTGTLWVGACRFSGAPLTKPQFVKLYVAALLLEKSERCRELAAELGLASEVPPPADVDRLTTEELAELLAKLASRIPPEKSWSPQQEKPTRDLRLRKIRWKIDEERPWRSFIVQEIDLSAEKAPPDAPRVSAVLIDTCQYSSAPTLVPIPLLSVNSGVDGEMLDDQIATIEQWMADEPAPGRVRLMMGHHPYDALGSHTREDFDRLRAHGGLPLAVSAHTHDGHYIVHGGIRGSEEPLPGDPYTWLELNLGSILDWPRDYRTLYLARIGGRISFRSQRTYMERAYLRDLATPDEQKTWEARPGSPDSYLVADYSSSLDATYTEGQLRDAMLAAFAHRLEIVPTDKVKGKPYEGNGTIEWPKGCTTDDEVRALIVRTSAGSDLEAKTALLLVLDRFDRTRPKDLELDARFLGNSALWASKYKTARGRRPLVDDAYIVLPAR